MGHSQSGRVEAGQEVEVTVRPGTTGRPSAPAPPLPDASSLGKAGGVTHVHSAWAQSRGTVGAERVVLGAGRAAAVLS